jgi:N-acetylglucosaminyldiphosphoundecaprenol N-acetyl-beta-D-mannosaminyltransferase
VSASHCAHTPPSSAVVPLVNGVRLDPLSRAELPAAIEDLLFCGCGHVVHFLPAHPTVLARHDPEYRVLLNRGDLNLVDGASVALAVRLFGGRAARTTGSAALELLVGWGVDAGVRHYLFGGTPEVAKRLRRRLERDHPGVEIVGVESPPFGELSTTDLEAARDRIRAARADLVWVGLGSPKQDRIAERLRELDAAPVLLCVGAAFDFVSGAKRRAPLWMQRAGLEWLHRLASEPRRLWRRYVIGNPMFVASVLWDYLLTMGKGSRPSSVEREGSR